ncbi:unnamed protein product [Prunus brigantina]
MKWTKVLRIGALGVRFMGVDLNTIMFNMERGQDMTEACFFHPHFVVPPNYLKLKTYYSCTSPSPFLLYRSLWLLPFSPLLFLLCLLSLSLLSPHPHGTNAAMGCMGYSPRQQNFDF